MKRVFLVRKEVTLPYGEGNWQIMTATEFMKFKETNQAKGRKFVRLFQQDSDSDLIIKECEPGEAREIKIAMQKTRRCQQYAAKKGIVKIAYSQVNVDGEYVSSEELIADETQDIEKIVDRKLAIQSLYSAIAQLSNKEKELVQYVFFQDKTERELAVIYNVSAVAIHKRKAAVLKKLKSFLEN